MPPSLPEHLYHILDEADYLMVASEELSADEFLQNETLKRAFFRSKNPPNPPLEKGDFLNDSLHYPPFHKGGSGGILLAFS